MSIRMIAQMAGVSPSAVSLALQDSAKVSPALKARVRTIAARISYRPNAKVAELMAQVRAGSGATPAGCFGVFSLYDDPRPWERSQHLSLIFASMSARAAQLGYRIEPIWLEAPGMTRRRFRNILDARGIQGLLCFGSPDLTRQLPPELDHYAIVTVGLSIPTPLHRVTSHFYNDMLRTLNEVYRRGYRRPGLVLRSEERSGFAYSSIYLGWSESALGRGAALPILRLGSVQGRPLRAWLERHRPDAVILVQPQEALVEFADLFRSLGMALPHPLGVAALSHLLDGTGFCGMQQNQPLMGAFAVEVLLSRILHQDFGIPTHPRIQMVEGIWVEAGSLRPAR